MVLAQLWRRPRSNVFYVCFCLLLLYFLFYASSSSLILLPNLTWTPLRLYLSPPEDPVLLLERHQAHYQHLLNTTCNGSPDISSLAPVTGNHQGDPPRSPNHQQQHTDFHHQLLVNQQHHLLYCYIPKTGCTNWRRVLAVLANLSDLAHYRNISQDNVHEKLAIPRLESFPMAQRRLMLATYYKFVFVREPYARLLSAFLDKFVATYGNRYFLHFYVTILQRYRGLTNITTNNLPQHPNFTFTEFVRFLVDTDSPHARFEPHWERYHVLCRPCEVQWDFVGHVETMDEEATYILSHLNLTSKVAFPSRRASGYSEARSEEKLVKYYSQIPPDLIDKLRKLYEKDFYMFGYDPFLIPRLLDKNT